MLFEDDEMEIDQHLANVHLKTPERPFINKSILTYGRRKRKNEYRSA